MTNLRSNFGRNHESVNYQEKSFTEQTPAGKHPLDQNTRANFCGGCF